MTESGSSVAPDPEDQADDELATGELEAVKSEVVDGEHVAADDADRRVTMAASFSGPLPPPEALAEYDQVLPGLGREIVDQWKAETAHRHQTITAMRKTDHAAMEAYYEGEKRGQTIALAAFIGVLLIAGLAILLDRPLVGIAGLVVGGGSVVWSMRRRSDTPQEQQPPTNVADGDEVEKVD